jgi:hypothetical protein
VGSERNLASSRLPWPAYHRVWWPPDHMSCGLHQCHLISAPSPPPEPLAPSMGRPPGERAAAMSSAFLPGGIGVVSRCLVERENWGLVERGGRTV